jgi:alpha-beta hydrolase superfamily lysophospholipase
MTSQINTQKSLDSQSLGKTNIEEDLISLRKNSTYGKAGTLGTTGINLSNQDSSTALNDKSQISGKGQNDDQGSDGSTKSATNKFRQVTMNARPAEEAKKYKDDDIIAIFAEDKTKFLGDFMADDYKVMRAYIPGNIKTHRIYYTKFEPTGPKVASLCMVHGFGEHMGRFFDLAEHFVKKGFVVHLIDLRGFGHSGGARACATVQEMHMDIDVLLRQAHRDLPLFVYGHSMGGALVTSLFMRNPYLNVAGVILTSALFGLPKERKFSAGKLWFLRLFGDELEEVMLNSMVSPTALFEINPPLRKIFDDRLLVPILSMKMAKSLIEMIDYIVPSAHKFKYPCLIIHGFKDSVTPCDDSVRFYNKISSEEKTLKIFPDGYHELHHDRDKESLKTMISDWMLKRIDDHPKKIGQIHSLKYGIKKNKYQTLKLLLGILLTALYFIILKRLKSNPTYNTKMKLFFFPIYYLYTLLSKLRRLQA